LNGQETADQSAQESGGAQSIERGGNYAMKIVGQISAILFCTIAVACASAEQKGASVYKTNCALCHGASGDANTPAGKKFAVPSFHVSDAFKKSDAELLEFIKAGKGKMPAWSDVLSDDEVKSVIVYIRTLDKTDSAADNSAAHSDDQGNPKQ
jgi:mono/diheme cytochrome c family protein